MIQIQFNQSRNISGHAIGKSCSRLQAMHRLCANNSGPGPGPGHTAAAGVHMQCSDDHPPALVGAHVYVQCMHVSMWKSTCTPPHQRCRQGHVLHRPCAGPTMICRDSTVIAQSYAHRTQLGSESRVRIIGVFWQADCLSSSHGGLDELPQCPSPLLCTESTSKRRAGRRAGPQEVLLSTRTVGPLFHQPRPSSGVVALMFT